MARPTFRRLEVEASPALRAVFERGTSGDDYDESVMDALTDSTTRNATIVGEIRRLIVEGHSRIMFFSASVRHADLIVAALRAGARINSHFVTWVRWCSSISAWRHSV